MNNNNFFSIHEFDTPPKIDFHLWSIDQAIFLIREWATNKYCFDSEYFGIDKRLHSRVKLAREWLDKHWLNYLCLADSGVDAISVSENSMTKPTSKDGHIIVFAIVC